MYKFYKNFYIKSIDPDRYEVYKIVYEKIIFIDYVLHFRGDIYIRRGSELNIEYIKDRIFSFIENTSMYHKNNKKFYDVYEISRVFSRDLFSTLLLIYSGNLKTSNIKGNIYITVDSMKNCLLNILDVNFADKILECLNKYNVLDKYLPFLVRKKSYEVKK